MANRPCLDCGALSPNSRCPAHQRTLQQAKRSRRPYTAAMLRRRAQVVAQWRAEHGDLCPGWRRPAHPSHDLTADHMIAVGAGGDEDGPLAVLCRSCNSSKKTTLGFF